MKGAGVSDFTLAPPRAGRAASPSVSLDSSYDLTRESFKTRRADGRRGAPPFLRGDKEARDLIRRFSNTERKDWSAKELLQITRGILFGLRAAGVPEAELESAVRRSLGNCYRTGLVNLLVKSPVRGIVDSFKTESIEVKVLLVPLSPLVYLINVAEAGWFCASHWRYLRSSGEMGTSFKEILSLRARDARTLGAIAAHEAFHSWQNQMGEGRGFSGEMFSWVLYAAFLDGAGSDNSGMFSWERAFKEKRNSPSRYWEDLELSAAVSIAVRGAHRRDGWREALSLLKALSHVHRVADVRWARERARNARGIEGRGRMP